MEFQKRLKNVLNELEQLEDELRRESGNLDKLIEIEKTYKSLNFIIQRSYSEAADKVYKRQRLFKERYSR